MSTYSSINDFNKFCVDTNALTNKYDIDEYIRLVHSNFSNDIDLTLLNDYSNHLDTFCVDSNTLYKFNLIQNNKEIFISKFIKYYKLIKDIDYSVISNNHNKEYKLSLQAFKYCLILSGNKKYITYFLFIENMIFNYKKYEELYNKNNNTLFKFDLLNKNLNDKSELYNNSLNELTIIIKNLDDKILKNTIISNNNIKDIRSNINAIIDLYENILEKINETYIKSNYNEIDIEISNLQKNNKELTENINKELKIITSHLINIEKNTFKKSKWWQFKFKRR